MSDVRDSDGRRFLPVLDIVKLLREAPFKHWPIDGLRIAREFMLAVRASGIEGSISYHSEWLKKSAVGEKSNAGREHRFLLEVLRLLCQWDQLDPSSLASAEITVRRVHQIEMAVRRNLKQPDYEGLDAILDAAIDSSGAVVLPSISSWLAEKQKAEGRSIHGQTELAVGGGTPHVQQEETRHRGPRRVWQVSPLRSGCGPPPCWGWDLWGPDAMPNMHGDICPLPDPGLPPSVGEALSIRSISTGGRWLGMVAFIVSASARSL